MKGDAAKTVPLKSINEQDFEEVNCIFCGIEGGKSTILHAPDRLNNIPGTYHLAQCHNCKLLFQDPRPNVKAIMRYYPDEMGYFQPRTPSLSKWKEKLRKLMLAQYYGYRQFGTGNILIKLALYPMYFLFSRNRAIPQFVENGHVLEIGCSTGTHLQELRDLGWVTTGIEPNRKAAHFALSERGLNIVNSTISEADFPEDSFDVVIMEMVLEHIHDPVLAIEKITKWLKKDGQLIFSLPYFKGFEFSVFKDYAYGLQLPTHLYFFDTRTVKELLGTSYRQVRFVFQHFDRDMVVSAQYKFKETRSMFMKLIGYNFLIRLFLIKPFVTILSAFGRSSRVTVFATRN